MGVSIGVPLEARAQERTVTLWHAYGEAEARGLDAAVDAFAEAHPEIRVRVVHNAFGAYLNKLSSAIPTGRGPDVFIDAHERLETYIERRLVAPLPPLDLRGRLEFEPAALAALTANGSTYGLPVGIKSAALFVNTDLLGEPPATLEALESVDLPDGVFPLVFEAENGYYAAALLHAYGGRMLDEETGSFAFEGPAAERAIEHIARLIRDGVVPEESNGDLVKQLFTSGRAATAISGPWLMADLPPTLEWAVHPLPPVASADGARMQPFVTVEAAFLAEDSSNPDDAGLLIAFLAGPEGSRIRADVAGAIPASRTYWETTGDIDPTIRMFHDAARAGTVMPAHPHMRLVFEPTEKALRKVLRGGVDPATALAEAHRRFDDAIRPPPPKKDPTFGLVFVSAALFLLTLLAVRRARSRQFRGELRASVSAYAWVAHAAIAVGLLVIAPIVVATVTSFFAGRGTDMHYVGLSNYTEILTARGGALFAPGSFWLVLLVTVLWTAINIVLHVTIGVALAMLLHHKGLRLRGMYRVLLILPWAVPNYVTALSWKGMFHRQFGAVNAILEALGAEPVSWFAHFATAFSANVATNTWLGFPFMMVVTLGALSAIPDDLYEAAEVDGASAWQRFHLITLPQLRPMLAPAVAMGAVWTFNMFNVIYLVSGGEPDGTTEILVSEAYRWAFTRSSQYGYAAAYAVLIFGLLLVGTRQVSRRMDGMGGTT
jgi:arabinogalactan oligomer/maltooligosaccharide transport system permease protein